MPYSKLLALTWVLLMVHHVPVSRSMMHINDDAAVDVCLGEKGAGMQKVNSKDKAESYLLLKLIEKVLNEIFVFIHIHHIHWKHDWSLHTMEKQSWVIFITQIDRKVLNEILLFIHMNHIHWKHDWSLHTTECKRWQNADDVRQQHSMMHCLHSLLLVDNCKGFVPLPLKECMQWHHGCLL